MQQGRTPTRLPAPAATAHANGEHPASAKAAGLRYVTDATPGIRRRRNGNGWTYTLPDGAAATGDTRVRIKSIGIPPAWTDVWISPHENGHIQATGRDARGRKQYRYHERWTEYRDGAKFGRLTAFARALPRIRDAVDADLSRPGMPREKVLALVVRLLELTLIRVGNEEYARENQSYGLSTMRSKHARVDGSRITFRFRGKSGKDHNVSIRNRQLARIVRRSQELPGEELFQYIDEQGEAQTVGSSDINAYLREIAGEDFTAKDFRTWGGTVLMAMALRANEGWESEGEARRHVKDAIAQVAKGLGNTPTVCRKCYVHPAVIEAYMESSDGPGADSAAAGTDGLAPEEAMVLQTLEERAAAAD